MESITFDHDCNVWLPIESERREYHGAGISRINNVCGMLAKKIQGHVSKNDGTDFPSHRVEFYKKMGNDLILLGAAKTDSNGNYRFSTMEDSIFLNSTYDGHVDAELPVYAENVLTRQNSHSILLNSSGITTVDIRHLPKAIPSGIGTIEGSITNMNDDTLKKMRIFLVNMETNEIYNTTLIKNPLTFRFINLPVGHYQIFCDKFGIIDSLSPILHISTEYPKLEHLPFVLKPDRLALRATYYETGLAEISNKPEFISIFPNPVAQILNTQITISAPSKTAIELFNLNGSMIYHAEYNCQKGDNLFQIITTSFNNGLYILKVKNENNIYTTKVLIQHQN